MTVVSELIVRYPALRTDTDSGGGRMSKHAVTDDVRQNFLRDWTLAESQNGGEQLRKFFLHVANLNNDGLAQVGLILEAPTLADDIVTLFAGTPTDTVADCGADEYGSGTLQSPAAAGATSLAVVLESADLTIFRDGDTVFVSDGVNEELHDAVTVVQDGAVVTVTLAEGDQLAHAYAAGAACASVLPLSDLIQAAIGTPEIVSAAGTLDAAQLVPDALGGIDQTITLTFTSNMIFSCVSDVRGLLGTSTIGADFAPVNADFARPFFTIPSTAWGGAWAAGQVVRFATVAAASAFWLHGRLPAGAAPTSDPDAQEFKLRLIGGSI